MVSGQMGSSPHKHVCASSHHWRHEAESEMIQRLLDDLDDREATILRLRYGLGDMEEEPMTLKEIGKRIGLTRERVRQLEAGALRKLYKTMSERS